MADNLYSLSLNWNSAGQFCTTVLHYKFDDAGYTTTQAAANALISKWNTTSKAAFLAMMPSAVTLLSIKARKVSGVGGFEGVLLITSGGAGTRSGEISASGINPVLVHYPNDERLGRGKTFLPGVREADVKDGIFTTVFVDATISNIPTAFSDLVLAGGGTPTASFVVKKRTPLNTWWEVLATQLSDMVGQQRRRQRPS